MTGVQTCALPIWGKKKKNPMRAVLYLGLGEKTVVLSKWEMKVKAFERLGKPETGHLVSATHAKVPSSCGDL